MWYIFHMNEEITLVFKESSSGFSLQATGSPEQLQHLARKLELTHYEILHTTVSQRQTLTFNPLMAGLREWSGAPATDAEL